MTTSASPAVIASISTASRSGILPGFGSLLRKELMEWRRGWRAWTVLGVTTVVMILTVMNSWLISQFGMATDEPIVMDPTANLGIAVASHMYVVAAILAVMSVLVVERESGTLAWTASKPVSRVSIWLSKWTVAIAMIFALSALIPFGVAMVEAYLLYGPVEVAPVGAMVLAMAMAVVFYSTLVLATSTFVNSQAGVAAIAISVAFFVPQIAGILPVGDYLPTSVVGWGMALAAGEQVSLITPISWALTTLAMAGLALWRIDRLEL